MRASDLSILIYNSISKSISFDKNNYSDYLHNTKIIINFTTSIEQLRNNL